MAGKLQSTVGFFYSDTITHLLSGWRYLCISQVHFTREVHDLLLKQHKAFWVYTLQALSPSGLNDELLVNMKLQCSLIF